MLLSECSFQNDFHVIEDKDGFRIKVTPAYYLKHYPDIRVDARYKSVIKLTQRWEHVDLPDRKLPIFNGIPLDSVKSHQKCYFVKDSRAWFTFPSTFRTLCHNHHKVVRDYLDIYLWYIISDITQEEIDLIDASIPPYVFWGLKEVDDGSK